MDSLSFWIMAFSIPAALWLVYEIYSAPHYDDEEKEELHIKNSNVDKKVNTDY